MGEWGADEIDVDLEEEVQEGGGDCNTFTLASSVLEELGEGCAETEPEQSSGAAGWCGSTSRTWKEESD